MSEWQEFELLCRLSGKNVWRAFLKSLWPFVAWHRPQVWLHVRLWPPQVRYSVRRGPRYAPRLFLLGPDCPFSIGLGRAADGRVTVFRNRMNHYKSGAPWKHMYFTEESDE